MQRFWGFPVQKKEQRVIWSAVVCLKISHIYIQHQSRKYVLQSSTGNIQMETLWHSRKMNEVFNFNANDWSLFFFQLNDADSRDKYENMLIFCSFLTSYFMFADSSWSLIFLGTPSSPPRGFPAGTLSISGTNTHILSSRLYRMELSQQLTFIDASTLFSLERWARKA